MISKRAHLIVSKKANEKRKKESVSVQSGLVCVCCVRNATVYQPLCYTGWSVYLGVGCEQVDDAEDWNERHADEPHDSQLPLRHRLQETHLS